MDEHLPIDGAVQMIDNSDVANLLEQPSTLALVNVRSGGRSHSLRVIPSLAKSINRGLQKHTDILECAWDSSSRKSSSSSAESDKDEVQSGYLQNGNEFDQKSIFTSVRVYFCWIVLMVFAFFREFLRKNGFEKNLAAVEHPKQRDFVPLFAEFEAIYARNCYMRVRDVFERPICGVPGATVKLLDRYTDDFCWSFKNTGTETEVINMGSYNYLGFAQTDGSCAMKSTEIIGDQGLSTCSTAHQLGYSKAQHELEILVAQFLGVEDAICFSMGFATNSLNTPCIIDENSLVISDQYNHASLILGCRMSKANVRVFKHNDINSLEKVIRNAIIYGNTKTHKPYNKILVIVEGIYSMEGSICNLPAIIALKKKYRFYIYLDEAHSIGAMGPKGRGVVDYWGCDPNDVDVLMGTFTKSFGSAGGYLAGSKQIINHLRVHSPAFVYAVPMSPPVAQQIITSMQIIMGLDGTNDGEIRRRRLRKNTHYFRQHLKRMGCNVYGSGDSPVVPIMLYYPTKCGFFGREMLKHRVGVVVVSFPATHMTESRLRVCLSAAHTKEMLDHTLNAIREVALRSSTLFPEISQRNSDLIVKW